MEACAMDSNRETASEPSWFTCSYRVSYADCTVGNHVYYGRYAAILEWARGEFFRSLDIPFLTLQNQGILFPVIRLVVEYHKPARYDDLLRIDLCVTELRRAFLSFAYRICLAASPSSLLVEASTRHLCTDPEDRPRRIPEELVARLTPYLCPPE